MKLSAALFAMLLIGSSQAHSANVCVSKVSDIDSKDALAVLVANMESDWSDNNISSGTTSISAGQVDKVPEDKASLTAFSEDIFKTNYATVAGNKLPDGTVIHTSVGAVDAKFISEAVDALAVGVDQPKDKDVLAGFHKDVSKALKALGTSSNLVGVVSKIKIQDDNVQQELNEYSFTVINKTTRKVIVFFVIEGTQ